MPMIGIPADNDTLERRVGRLEGQLPPLAKRLDEVHTDLAAIRGDVRAVRDAVLMSKGSWKLALALVMIVGTLSAVAGAIAAWVGGSAVPPAS